MLSHKSDIQNHSTSMPPYHVPGRFRVLPRAARGHEEAAAAHTTSQSSLVLHPRDEIWTWLWRSYAAVCALSVG
jgi:hypothetical protein